MNSTVAASLPRSVPGRGYERRRLTITSDNAGLGTSPGIPKTTTDGCPRASFSSAPLEQAERCQGRDVASKEAASPPLAQECVLTDELPVHGPLVEKRARELIRELDI